MNRVHAILIGAISAVTLAAGIGSITAQGPAVYQVWMVLIGAGGLGGLFGAAVTTGDRDRA